MQKDATALLHTFRDFAFVSKLKVEDVVLDTRLDVEISCIGANLLDHRVQSFLQTKRDEAGVHNSASSPYKGHL